MTPTTFPQANTHFHPPSDLDESQCATIPAFAGEVLGGNIDGVGITVVAWQPSLAELEDLNAGCPVFLACVGGLPPHHLATRFPGQ